MPTNLYGRFVLILVVLYASLSLIFQWMPPSLVWLVYNTKEPISLKTALKPGIDMVGGTSLLYEIKPAPGAMAQNNLAEQVMQSLKKRVDPDGVRNLIWRPQGATRLEIQMPMNEKTQQIKALRDKFTNVQRELEATNIRQGEVIYAVQELKGEQRIAKLKELEQTSDARAKLFAALSTTWDQIQDAKTAKNAAENARLNIQWNQLMDQLDSTNLQVNDLQTILEIEKPDVREKALSEMKGRFTDFPKRQTAINAFVKGYAEYSQIKGAIDDAVELKRLLKGSGVLEFHILADNLSPQEQAAMQDRLQKRGPRVQAGDTVRWYEMDRGQVVSATVEKAVQELMASTDDRERTIIIKRAADGRTNVERLFEQLRANYDNPVTRKAIQKEIEDALLGAGTTQEYAGKKWVLCYITSDKSLTQREGQRRWHLARAGSRNDGMGNVITFEFDALGGRYFGDLTTANVKKPMAIMLDDRVISAPNINEAITSGSGQISAGQAGGFSESELNYMVNTFNAGALPAQLAEEPISEQQIGPQLGADNLRKGLQASIIGLIAVGIFMLVYYHISGIIASLALLMNMIIILGVMSALNATWTLPAVAGIVLTIGMSVDANVLVFERLREETARGLSLKMAMRNAYDRAASAIIDSNAITVITCLILYWLGSEEVKGFGLTLLIGLISSLFTALFVTKTIFAAMLKYFNLQKLGSLPVSWPALGRALHPNINWMKLSKYFMIGSAVMIVMGIVAIGVTLKRGELFDIEFASGTSVQFELKQPMTQEEVRSVVASAPEAQLPSPAVVAVGTDKLTYEVVTPSNNAKEVTDQIVSLFGNKLNIQVRSNYDGVDDTFEQAVDKEVFPILQDTRSIAGMAPAALRSHMGGAAIVLKNLNPHLTSEEIKKRLEQVRLQPQAGASSSSQYRQIDVDVSTDGNTAIIMTSDAAAQYDPADPIRIEQWSQDLAKPTWLDVLEAIHNPPRLQKVTNFNPQVAGEMQQDAFIALALSLLVIMGYIWLRFGNLKYGTATVAAMLHDTLLVIGFIGISHFVGHLAFFQKALLIEPFRVNLTLVAAVLTVMSYSMVDTIVVFDRIRENRGRFGHVDATVINDSVNQTLSRTLLTVFTTTLSVFVMYVFGGPGIHGFTFVMLIGILIGTYSSFAIAAPILLIGEKQAEASRKTAVGRRQLQGA